MADNKEEVLYQYVGDVSSLRQATTEALGLLDKYQEQINRISADGGFGKSAKAAKSFQSQINATTKQITSMQNQMKKVSDIKVLPSSKTAQELSGSLSSINQIFSSLANSSKLSTKEVQALTSQLKFAKQGFADNASAVDVLVQKELKWQQTLGSVSAKTTKVRDNLDAFKTRITSTFDPMLAKMRTLSAPFQSLTAKLQSFKDKAAEAFGKVSQLASTVAAAFRRVSTAEGDAASAASRSATIYSRLKNALNSVQSSLKQETRLIRSALVPALSSLGSMLASGTTHIRAFDSSMKTLASSTNVLKHAITGLIGVNLGQWLAYATDQSISYTENLNLFSVAMGECVDQGTQFVNTMSELYGMDPSNLIRYAGNFYQLADAIDMPSQASANLSLGLTKAANDIASLFNVDIETVFENLSSGMQGMSRAVRKYGMDIRTTTLEQTALSLGLTQQVESMSEANRQGLRFITMMRQASNASGDFASTIETPANQLRIFKEQISQLGRAIGDLFITPLATAIQYINGFIMAVRMVIQFIGSLFGAVNRVAGVTRRATDTADNLASSIGGVGGAASDTTKKLKAMLAPFDELNVLSMPDAGGGSGGGGGALSDLGTLDPAIEAEIAAMQWKLEEVRMKAVEVRDALLEFFGFKVEDGTILSWDSSQFEANLINKFPEWTQTIQATFNHWSEIIEGFKAVFRSLADVASTVWQKISNTSSQFINDDSMSEFISNLGGNLQNLASWISENANGLANLAIAFGLFKGLAPVATFFSSIVSPISKLGGLLPGVISAVSSVTAPMLLWSAVIGVIAFALADLLKNNEDFRAKVGKSWESLVKLIQDLWQNLLGPIFSKVAEVIGALYNDTIKPIVEQVATIVMTLWSDLLQPLLSWLVNALGPTISNLITNLLSIISWMFNNLGGFISGLLQVLQGVIDFIAGVFTGDWSRAWNGIVNIFAGIFNAIASVCVAVFNAVISVINSAISLVYNAVVSLINLVLGAISGIASMVGQSIDLRITAGAPQIPYMDAPRVAMANGGVVTGPTKALIGEGRYDEAVMPLGNSPQMREFADSVANRVNSGEQMNLLREQNEILRQILAKTGVSLDGKMISDVVSSHQRSRARALGV